MFDIIPFHLLFLNLEYMACINNFFLAYDGTPHFSHNVHSHMCMQYSIVCRIWWEFFLVYPCVWMLCVFCFVSFMLIINFLIYYDWMIYLLFHVAC